MVLTQKLRIAALEQMFDLKWSRAHAGHGQTKDGRGILRHSFGIVREYADHPVIFQNYTRFSSIFCPQEIARCAISFRLSWELPATPGCRDQYVIAGQRSTTWKRPKP